jgi:hypothetical protein
MARDEGIITATDGREQRREAMEASTGRGSCGRPVARGWWSFGGGRMQSKSSSSCKVQPERFRLPRRWKDMEVPSWEVRDHREERSFFHHHGQARLSPMLPPGSRRCLVHGRGCVALDLAKKTKSTHQSSPLQTTRAPPPAWPWPPAPGGDSSA